MAWNQPDQQPPSRGDRPDPWGRDRGGKRPPEPPEPGDELQKLATKARRALASATDWRTLVLLFPVLFGLWLGSGFLMVEPTSMAIVDRLDGSQTLAGPGLHWHVSGLEPVTILEVGIPHTLPFKAGLLTLDGSLVNLNAELSYRINDPAAFVEHSADPESLLAPVAEASLQQSLAGRDLASLLQVATPLAVTSGISGLKADARIRRLGVTVEQLRVTGVSLPTEVQPEADRLAALRRQQQLDSNKAHTDASNAIAAARAQAGQLENDAAAYRAEVIDNARKESDRLAGLLAQYHQSPALVKERLYMDAMETLLNKVRVVTVAVPGISPVINMAPPGRPQGLAGSRGQQP